MASADALASNEAFARLLRGGDTEGYSKVDSPRFFSFPADHGPHPEYRLEWWYYTGNLETQKGRHFGYQLTFFRMSLTPKPVKRASKWGTNQMYMAHLALTDVETKRFYRFERKSRGALDLAGAITQPMKVWVENWEVQGLDGSIYPPMRGASQALAEEFLDLYAAEDDVSVDLMLRGGKPIVFFGDNGMFQRSAEAEVGSYYYSLTRMPSMGTIRIAGESFHVQGLSWLDREWGTRLLGTSQAGWNWFALQLDDEREVMFYQLRKNDGSTDPKSHGALVSVDGEAQILTPSDIQLDVLSYWQSPLDGTRYPSRFRMQIPSFQLDLTIEPYLEDQELSLSMRYWEGAVKVSGTGGGQPVSGSGYVELTGFSRK